MKVALAQLNFHVGNFEANTRKILSYIEQAKAAGAALIVFPELAVCGYPPRDFLDYPHFLKECTESVQQIARQVAGITVIIGSPAPNPVPEGKDLYNAAYVLADGEIKAVRHKALLPTYDIFDEYRYFEPGRLFETITINGEKVALTVCEDLWVTGENPLYATFPMEELIRQQPSLMINIAASPFDRNKRTIRLEVLQENARKYQLPLLYVNHVGAQTELIFDGGSCALTAKGELAAMATFFEEELLFVDTQQLNPISTADTPVVKQVYQALLTGIREYFHKQGFTKAILGSSGGIDSALVQTLASHALGAENVLAVMLPSRYSSDHSVNDAVQLSQNLGNPYHIISIEPTFKALEATLAPQFAGTTSGIAEENMQSRSRGVLLMALSNKFGHILLNTSNKSEIAVGYGTLYGDMCGGLSVIGDLYKTQVYELSKWINRQQVVIPENILSKAPSAELRPDQKDTDSLPEYDALDQILEAYIEQCLGPDQIIAKGYSPELVKRVLKMVNRNEYKRYQTPPILRVSSRAFGMGRRLPIVAEYLV